MIFIASPIMLFRYIFCTLISTETKIVLDVAMKNIIRLMYQNSASSNSSGGIFISPSTWLAKITTTIHIVEVKKILEE